ncbi:MAG: hypothetical protein ACI9A7_002372 [Cyclobacteriaceae bacterium]|jgi:hypothetical protein
MEAPRELYHEEVRRLKDFRLKLESHTIYQEQLEEFSDDYEELVAQAKVITRVSDRLQKKLDGANIQIRERNTEIKEKNLQLEDTILELARLKISRRASTVMLIVALTLFVLEQVILQPIIEDSISIPYLDLVILVILFFGAKFVEGGLEEYFLKQERKKIMKKKE